MKRKLRKAGVLFLFVILGFGMILIGRVNLTDCSNTEDWSLVENEFISRVWPSPNSSVPIKCFLTSMDPVFRSGEGVGVTLVSARVDENWQLPPQIPIENRVKVLIDGIEITKRALVSEQLGLSYCDEENNCFDTGRPAGVNMSWRPFLFPGLHESKILVENDMGKILEFNWTFTITW